MSTIFSQPGAPGALQVKITRIAQNTFIDQSGNLQRQVIVSYMVGPHGPFTESFTAAGFTVEAATAQIQKSAATVAGVANIGN